MWVVFSTVKMNNGTYEDFYSVVTTEDAAREAYEDAIKRKRTYCAGYAKIKGGTEPHWTDGKDDQCEITGAPV